jgi:hypothetical protein
MNEVPPDQGEADEVDDLYRRASAADSSRPSESVRRAVFDHAAELAAQRAREAAPVKIDFTLSAANQPWRRPAIFGTLAAAALAGFMIAPQFFSPSSPSISALPPAEYTQPLSGAAPSAQAPTAAQSPAAGQTPTAATQVPAAAPALPPGAATSQTNDRIAEIKADKRALRSTAQVAASPPVFPADNGSADAQNPANVITTTQAQSAAKARSGANAQSAASVPRFTSVPRAANAPASASEAAGANVDARRMQSVGSSVSALSAGRPQVAAPMSPAPRPADQSAELRRAAEAGDVAALQAVLGTHPAIDARDDGGRTALMLATLHGQARAVEVLLASGADPNAADARGTTPLQTAETANQPAIADLLRRAGAR